MFCRILQLLISTQYEELLTIKRDCDKIKSIQADIAIASIQSTSNPSTNHEKSKQVSSAYNNAHRKLAKAGEKRDQASNCSKNEDKKSSLSRQSILPEVCTHNCRVDTINETSPGYFYNLAYDEKAQKDDRCKSFCPPWTTSHSDQEPMSEHIDNYIKINPASINTNSPSVQSSLHNLARLKSLKSNYYSDPIASTRKRSSPPATITSPASVGIIKDNNSQLHSYNYHRAFSTGSNLWPDPAVSMTTSPGANNYQEMSPESYYINAAAQRCCILSEENFSDQYHSEQVNLCSFTPLQGNVTSNLESKNINYSSFPRPCDSEINSRETNVTKDCLFTYCSIQDEA